MFEQATLGGGCFWCLDASYRLFNGVKEVESGYAGGFKKHPSYEDVGTGVTGHAEVVRIKYDPNIISYDQLLDIFWTIHDPTTLNYQGADIGNQYRSIILYENNEQREIAIKSKAKAQRLWQDPIVTEIIPLTEFWKAEDYHQNFFVNHPELAYCQLIINPKLTKLRKSFNELINTT